MRGQDVLPDGKPLYTIHEACAVLRITRSTLYRHIQAGRLHTLKIGRRTVVSRADLEAVILSHET